MSELLKKFDSAETVYKTENAEITESNQWVEEEILMSSTVVKNTYADQLRSNFNHDLDIYFEKNILPIKQLEVVANINDYKSNVINMVFDFIQEVKTMEQLSFNGLEKLKIEMNSTDTKTDTKTDIKIDIVISKQNKMFANKRYEVKFGEWEVQSNEKVIIKARFSLEKYKTALDENINTDTKLKEKRELCLE